MQATSESVSEHPSSPEERAPWYSLPFFHWVGPLVRKGADTPLQGDDLLELCASEESDAWAHAFSREHPSNAASRWPVFVTLWRLFRTHYRVVFALAIINLVTILSVPLLIRQVIAFLAAPEKPLSDGLALASLLAVLCLVANLSVHHMWHRVLKLGMRMRAALVVNIYEKSLRLSPASRRESSSGEIVNLMSTDAANIYNVTLPLQLALASVLLYQLLGVSSLAGLAVMLLMLPLSARMAKRVMAARTKLVSHGDERVSLIGEILAGIRVIKYYAWEESFLAKVRDVRARERKELSRIALFATLATVFFLSTPLFVGMVTFSVHLLRGEALRAPEVFASLAIFGVLRPVMAQLPFIFSSFVNAFVSQRRLQRHFSLAEIPVRVEDESLAVGEIRVNNVTASWGVSHAPGQTPPDAILDVNLHVRPGELVAIVGSVGAGKSSLLSALLGDLAPRQGDVRSRGTFGLVPQQAWILNATLRANILFDKPFDRARYLRVLEACQLATDLRSLPAGDATEIGERGVNLSGGQKQRVCLARALYAQADIVFLDDTFSALDNRVGAAVFQECVQKELAGRTRILVTHRLEYVRAADRILCLEDGRIVEAGTPAELFAAQGAFARLYADYTRPTLVGEPNVSASASVLAPKEESVEAHALARASTFHGLVHEDDALAMEKGRLVLDEERNTGTVRGDLYSLYMKLLSPYGLVWVLLLAFGVRELVATAADGWLAVWSAREGLTSVGAFIGIFIVLGLLACGVTFARSYVTWRGGVRAAMHLHDGLLTGILRAPMSFFDSTPLGRVLNRFGKDTEAIDQFLPNTFLEALGCFFVIATTLLVMLFATPLMVFAVVPLAVFYFRAQKMFRKSNREVKRLESISRSPLYAHFSETLSGVPVIRAFRAESRFVSESVRRFRGNQRSFYTMISLNRWLGTRLEFIGAVVAGGAAFFAVLARGQVNPGLAGVSVTYAFLVTSALNWAVRMLSEIESNMNSVERVMHYADVPAENWEGHAPDASWPARGVMEFDAAELRYGNDLPPVLQGFSLRIDAGETVGVVGRTGAGKSTLFSALFRFTELSAGRIVIDGVDIATVPLTTLRQRMAIIPQDPVLFAGTLRRNLDPFGEHGDEELETCLRKAHLDHWVARGLETAIEEGGANLSVGERQLLCLARALLRKVRVLLMDEATASVDFETDALIHHTVKEHFAQCTVLIIAHRIGTVLGADRVVVLEKGRVGEVGRPKDLLERPHGLFQSLAREA